MHCSRAADVCCLSGTLLSTSELPYQPTSLSKHVTKEMLEIQAFERETIKYQVTITKSQNQKIKIGFQNQKEVSDLEVLVCETISYLWYVWYDSFICGTWRFHMCEDWKCWCARDYQVPGNNSCVHCSWAADVPCLSGTLLPKERWGAGVEYHFQEISWNLRPVVNGT